MHPRHAEPRQPRRDPFKDKGVFQSTRQPARVNL